MDILITGAGGFVGRNLVAALENLRDGKDRTRPALQIGEILKCTRQTTDAELKTYCAKADFVFHLAGVNRPKDEAEFMRGNRDLTAKLLSLLEDAGNTCPVMLSSSTQAERDNPSILNSSRKKRIAAGSGTSVVDVNRVIKQYDAMQQMMKQFSGKNMKKLQKKMSRMGGMGGFGGLGGFGF